VRKNFDGNFFPCSVEKYATATSWTSWALVVNLIAGNKCSYGYPLLVRALGFRVHKLCVGPANQLMSRRLVLCSTLGLKTMVGKKNSKKEECAVQMTEENVHIQFPMADVRVIISPSNKAASPSLKKIHR
jgi:hypothetical protein